MRRLLCAVVLLGSTSAQATPCEQFQESEAKTLEALQQIDHCADPQAVLQHAVTAIPTLSTTTIAAFGRAGNPAALRPQILAVVQAQLNTSEGRLPTLRALEYSPALLDEIELTPYLTDQDPEIRGHATLLKVMHTRESSIARAAAKDEHWLVRQLAAKAVQYLPTSEARAILAMLLHDPVVAVRWNAASMLPGIPVDQRQSLDSVCIDPDQSVRRIASLSGLCQQQS